MEKMEIVTGTIIVSTFSAVFCDLYSSPISDTRTAGLYFLGSASQIGCFLDILRNPKAEHVSKASLCVLHNCVLRSKNMMSED